MRAKTIVVAAAVAAALAAGVAAAATSASGPAAAAAAIKANLGPMKWVAPGLAFDSSSAKGKTVCPGFCCVIGNGMGAGRSSPYVDSVNPFDPEIKQALAAGITSFLAGSPGGGALPTGDSAVIKLAYGDVAGMVLQEGTVLGMNAQLSLADRDRFKDLVKQAKAHKQAPDHYE